MRGPETVHQFDKSLRLDFQKIHDLIEIARGKFTVKALNQCNCLFALQVAVANFLRCLIAGATDAELDEGSVEVQAVDAVVDGRRVREAVQVPKVRWRPVSGQVARDFDERR